MAAILNSYSLFQIDSLFRDIIFSIKNVFRSIMGAFHFYIPAYISCHTIITDKWISSTPLIPSPHQKKTV